MSEKDDDSLIGYDPLAWLHESGETNEEVPSLPAEFAAEDDVTQDGAEVDVVPELGMVDSSEVDKDVLTEQAVELIAPSGQALQIVLDSVQTIQNVTQLYERLLHALDEHNKIDIDASAVTMTDTATLQLLLVLKQTAVRMQKEVSIDFPSEKFIETAEQLGLAEMLNVDQAAAGFF